MTSGIIHLINLMHIRNVKLLWPKESTVEECVGGRGLLYKLGAIQITHTVKVVNGRRCETPNGYLRPVSNSYPNFNFKITRCTRINLLPIKS